MLIFPKKPLSIYITDVLITEQIITEQERAVYIYCIGGLLEYLLFSLTILCLSVITNQLAKGILFLCMLFLIKSFTGGVHAPNAAVCYMCSLAFFLFAVSLSSSASDSLVLAHPITFLTMLLIVCMVPPVCSPGKPVSEQKLKRYHRFAILFSFLFFCLDLLFYHAGFYDLCGMAHLTYAGILLLLLAGKLLYRV